jgi:osmoprotectant transport system permease protein
MRGAGVALLALGLAWTPWLPGTAERPSAGYGPLPADPAATVPQEGDEALEPVVVGSKPFAESLILAEVFAQLLEARGVPVDRRTGLGSTEVVFQALRADEVDVYPEYTGTGLLVLLGDSVGGAPEGVFPHLARAFRDRWGLRWLPPLGFENSYAISVRPATADSLGLRTLSDLAARGGGLTAGLSPDFIGRDDGLPGLEAAYGLGFADVRPLLQSVKYQALAEGAVDVIDAYTTDGALDRFGLLTLEDDADFFPPYEAAPLVGARLARTRPEAVAALTELAGLITVARMRRANREAEVEGRPVAEVAADLLAELGLTVGSSPASGSAESSGRSSFPAYLWARRGETLRLTLDHLILVGLSLGAAVLVAVPLGLGLSGFPGRAEGVIRSVGLLQTIPSIALLAFMIPALGIGTRPAVAALFLYSLFPIVRNTYTGVREADPGAVRAGRALGMTDRQVLLGVRLPLAAPVIMAGIRTAAVINVGTATLAAFIGAGGLGDPIVSGLALSDTRLILSGALPAAVLALVVDAGLAVVERGVAPRGLREPPKPA